MIKWKDFERMYEVMEFPEDMSLVDAIELMNKELEKEKEGLKCRQL